MKLNTHYKILVLLFSLTIICSQVFSQNDTIIYKLKPYGFIKLLPDGYANFRLQKSGGMGDIIQIGYGKYKIRKNEILVKTIEYPYKLESSYDMIRSKDIGSTLSTSTILVSDYITNSPLIGVSVQFEDDSDIFFSDQDGRLVIPRLDDDKKYIINIAYVGYQSLKVPFTPGSEVVIKVNMAEGNISIIDNERIRLMIEVKE